MNTLTKAIHTLKLTREVLRTKEFDNALSFATYKLNKIAKEESAALNDLKSAYKKEKLNITKLYTEQRKSVLKAFSSDLKAIWRDKELQHSQLQETDGQVVTVLDY
jgi:uncharacterized Zn finger protein